MKAIVLAGGLGTRLHPLTVNIPKPMIPVANQPMMEYVIYLLRKYNFIDITALLYHKPEIIKNYFGKGKDFGVNISYVEAKEDYGTAGAVKFAAKNITEPVLVISADLITDFNLEKAVAYHNKKKAEATLVLTREANPLPYGIVIQDKDGKVVRFLEKPSWSEVFSDTINCGIYILNPKILDEIPEGKPFDFSQDLFPRLLEAGRPIYGYVAEGLWKDIGSLTEYRKVHQEIAAGKQYQIAKGAQIANTARIEGVVIIGEKSIIGDNVLLVNSSIGRNCQINNGAHLRDCVILDNVIVGSEAQLERAIVAGNCVIGERSFLEEETVIGENSRIGSDADLKPFVKVWPNKIVEDGATVSRSMVWRERWTKSVFGPYGVTGLCNVEITPEFASALGTAYASVLGQGSQVSTSRDSHKASRMIYRALLSGVLSAGVDVSDLEMVPIPVNRFELKALKSRGGFHVRKSPYDPQVIDIKFFNEAGHDLTSSIEKKIERLFSGENFKRGGIEEVGELSFPFHRVAEYYKEGVLTNVEQAVIKKANFKVVVDYAYSSASQIFPAILGELGIEVIAINAHIDETKITKTRVVYEKSLAQLSQIVKSLDADLGIMLDAGAEKIFLCDEKGKILQGDIELAAMVILNAKANKKAQIAVPIKASRVIDELGKKYGAKIIRTKTSVRDMMDTSTQPGITMVGESQGGFMYPGFQSAFDAMFASIKLLELLAINKVKLSEVEAEVPKIRMAARNISCPPEKKGEVLRLMIDGLRGEKYDLTDGIKIFDQDDWVLILPDPARPIIHLLAEAGNETKAHKLVDQYIEKVDAIL